MQPVTSWVLRFSRPYRSDFPGYLSSGGNNCCWACSWDRYVTSAGAQPGDIIYVTKGAGFEGTAILAADHREALISLGVEQSLLERAGGFFHQISVVSEALAAAKAGVSAMHDITEGGFYGALWELLEASGRGCRVRLEEVPVLPETGRFAVP